MSGGDAAPKTEPDAADSAGAGLRFTDLHPDSGDFLAEVLAGLSERPKRLPTKYFYDWLGSQLFDAICELPEYYPTRAELEITEREAGAIAADIGPDGLLVEFGSGSSTKTRILLEHLQRPAAYLPVDISREHLLATAHGLARDFPKIEILPVCADYTQPMALPAPSRPARRRVVYFPGSTIGNFEYARAERFLERIADLVGPGGGLLIGVDLAKDRAILEPAYDDAAGVTADFNLNLLERINRELGADFDTEAFRHVAFYNDALGLPGVGRMEMHLESLRDQELRIGGRVFALAAGERALTEYSYKYSREAFAALATRAGFAVRDFWTDAAGLFSLQMLERSAEGGP